MDIHTLTAQQVFGTNFDQVFDQIFDQVFGQVFWTRKYNVEYYWDRNYSVQFYWDRKRLHANYYCLFRASTKNRLPAIY